MYGNLKKILWNFYDSRHRRTQLSIKFVSDIGKITKETSSCKNEIKC